MGRKYWVGMHTKLDVPVVISSGELHQSTNKIRAFYPLTDELVYAEKNFLRSRLAPASKAQISDQIMNKIRALDAQLSSDLTELHRKHVENHGLRYQGTKRASNRKLNRATHCWNCRAGLDSSVDKQCVACGWILCRCGACGCGYSSKR